MMPVTVVIPVEKGAEQKWWLPDGVKYRVCEYDYPHERGAAIDQGVRDAGTPFVVPMPHDGQYHQDDLEMLLSCCWNDRAAYPSLVVIDGDRAVVELVASPYCPNRLLRENFIGPTGIVRRDSFLAAGGWGDGAWDLWLRLGRMREVREARCGLRTPPQDMTVPPIRSASMATFYAQASFQTTYYRCQLPARYLPGVVMPHVPKLDMDDQDVAFFPSHEGTAIWQFPGDKFRHTVIRKMRELGIRTLVEVDDNYLDKYGTQAKAGWVFDEKDESSQHSIERHRQIVGDVDGVVVTTELLASRYRKMNPNVYVCPNQVDPSDWPVGEKPDDGVIRVGWFASGSHKNDSPLVETTLRWLKEQPNVEVVLMGVGMTVMKYQDPSGRIVREERQHWFPYLLKDGGAVYRQIPQSNDLAVYWKLMQDLDIGLYPVVPDHWSLFRSDLKGLEYGLAGVASVISDVPAYKDWVDGVTCLKARKPKDFLNHVKNLVRDPARARDLAAAAREYVLSERTADRNGKRWEEAVKGEG